MFLRRTRGLIDFLVALVCLWAAVYHTPIGAVLRNVLGWATEIKSSARPLLAYYSGGVYEAQELKLPRLPPPRPLAVVQTELNTGEALGYGVYATWMQLDTGRRKHGLALGNRYGFDVSRLEHAEEGPREVTRLMTAAARDLGSEDAAVVAMFAGYEPARYAAERVRAEGAASSLEEVARQLPPGYTDPIGHASNAMMLGTAYALAWPVHPSTPITSPFGYRTHPTLGFRKLHTGVDLGMSVGTEVRSVFAGVVRRASEDGVNGRVLVVDHGRGVTTAYCHNSELLVAVGQRIERGQVISRSGNTGRSTGPHLHYQLELAHEPMDPLAFRAMRASPVAAGWQPKVVYTPPLLVGRAVSERRVEVQGKSFPPMTELSTLVNPDLPEASIACLKDFSKDVTTDLNGAFSFSLALPKASKCSFGCDAKSTPLIVLSRDGERRETRSKPFTCWRKGASPALVAKAAPDGGVVQLAGGLDDAFKRAVEGALDGGVKDPAWAQGEGGATEW